MTTVSNNQLTLEFEPGLADQYPSAKHLMAERVHKQVGKTQKQVASDMDLSSSELTRKLSFNDRDHRNFSLDDLELFWDVTEDYTVLLYWVEKYLDKREGKRERALDQLAAILPEIQTLVRQATPMEGTG